jgi:hypothetical protein
MAGNATQRTLADCFCLQSHQAAEFHVKLHVNNGYLKKVMSVLQLTGHLVVGMTFVTAEERRQ